MTKRASLTLLRKIEILDAVDRAGPHCKKTENCRRLWNSVVNAVNYSEE